ncbi:MAG: hypothetical protein ACLQDV_15100 [Candidatus Binataceae bacterium]
MRKTTFVVVVFLLGLACQAKAQVGVSTGNDSMLASTNGSADTVTLTIPKTASSLEGLEGVVNVVLNSDTACATISAPDGWASVVTTETKGGNLCSRIYDHTFSAGEGLNTSYTFSWTGTTTYTAKLLSVANTSGVDVSSGAAAFGTNWTPPQVTTNYTGDYLLAFYMNSSNPTWTPPKQMDIALQNTTGGYPDLMTRTWQQAQGTTVSYAASSDGTGQWGMGQLVAFRPSTNR